MLIQDQHNLLFLKFHLLLNIDSLNFLEKFNEFFHEKLYNQTNFIHYLSLFENNFIIIQFINDQNRNTLFGKNKKCWQH